jgi:hypothetical protein
VELVRNFVTYAIRYRKRIRIMGSPKKHKIRETKKKKHRSRSKSRSPERSKHRHHKKHHKDRKKEKIIKDKNGEFISKYDTYDSEGKLLLFWVLFFLQVLIRYLGFSDKVFAIL